LGSDSCARCGLDGGIADRLLRSVRFCVALRSRLLVRRSRRATAAACATAVGCAIVAGGDTTSAAATRATFATASEPPRRFRGCALLAPLGAR
jgi:hypothetical protein